MSAEAVADELYTRADRAADVRSHRRPNSARNWLGPVVNAAQGYCGACARGGGSAPVKAAGSPSRPAICARLLVGRALEAAPERKMFPGGARVVSIDWENC